MKTDATAGLIVESQITSHLLGDTQMKEEMQNKVKVAKVLVMEDLVDAGEIDEYLRDEVKKECEVYGVVTNCIIHFEQSTQRVRVFIEFSTIEEALKAY